MQKFGLVFTYTEHILLQSMHPSGHSTVVVVRLDVVTVLLGVISVAELVEVAIGLTVVVIILLLLLLLVLFVGIVVVEFG